MLNILFKLVFCCFLFTAAAYSGESPQEKIKIYEVTRVAFLDDDGWNDELLVILGDKDLILIIRWYMGVIVHVGDKIEVTFQEDKSIIIKDRIYKQTKTDNVYFLG